ncbi:DUF5703 domain-containing protein [Vallitalea sediminicola]
METKNYFGTEDFKGYWHEDKRIIYNKRPKESWQCMPIGTGKTGAVVFVPDEGICLQINHGGSFDSDGNLPSLLRVNIEIEGKPFVNANNYEQELSLDKGIVTICADTPNGKVKVEFVAHQELDVISIYIEDMRNSIGQVNICPLYWRQGVSQTLLDEMMFFTETNTCSAFNEINFQSCVTNNNFSDPLKNLSYGTAVWVDNAEETNIPIKKVRSRKVRMLIAADSGKYTKDTLVKKLKCKIEKASKILLEDFRISHIKWWKNFWSKSEFDVKSNSRLQSIRAVWYLNRYFTASSMAGTLPPKFNGSIFLFDYDRRHWGGAYWFQNTRLQYWSLFKCGDLDYIMPFFDMYINALVYAKERTQSVYGHDGAIYLETMHSWGGSRIGDSRSGEGVVNNYIKNYFTGSLELLMMMLEYYRYTNDSIFAREKILPIADEVILFFFTHFPIKNGKLFLEKGASLETWWEADNPSDQIAGLKAVIPPLINIAMKHGYDKSSITRWKSYLVLLPELPRGTNWFKKNTKEHNYQGYQGTWQKPQKGNALMPADNVHLIEKKNYEDPELYAVWPFGLFGKNLPDYSSALNTFNNRIHKEPSNGWSQTAVWAARLGLADEASELLLKQFQCSSVFPSGMMFSPGNIVPNRPDIPECGYFDTIGVMTTAVNEMLIQDYTDKLDILPAWPKDEFVHFKLHSQFGKVVEETYKPK